ncbi:hypothetical protein CRUP_011547 [Coryphaenoides rupestris]|nr:hypothetical protein CRUP_011547 [Coryphaenoides rupestris]
MRRYSVDTVCTLYQSFQDGPASEAKGAAAAAAAGQGSGSGPGADTAGTGTLLRPCQRHMSPTERLRKDLACLFEIYLKPLQNETFLTLDEMESLFGSLPEMLDFQRVFLQTLEERIACSPDLSTLETPAQFKKLLFSLGSSFLYYADHFKLYSGFCANHIKVQKGRSRSLDRADAAAATVIDINSLLEREFSVQSLTSVVNEDCFYDPAESGVVDSGHDTPSP